MPHPAFLNATSAEEENPHKRILSNLLVMFQREIEQTLRPDLTTDYARFVADIMSEMLLLMADWAAAVPYPIIDARRAELAGNIDAGVWDAEGLMAPFNDPKGLDARLQAAVAASAAKGDGRITSLIGQIGTLHRDFIAAQKDRHETAIKTDRALMASLEQPLTLELFDAFVRTRLGATEDRALSIAKIPGGMSKETFLVVMASGREYVVRRNFPFGPTETSAPKEFDMLNRLREQGMPVPTPLFAEHGNALGQPALLMERIKGENAVKAGKCDPAVGRYIALELARLLAKLHNIEPANLGLSVSSGNPQAQIRAYVAEWRTWWEKHRIQPSSLLEAGFAWLDRNVPKEIERVVPIHGDARPDNMLFHNGEISALLDWEYLHAGDASEDLQYAKGFVEEFVTWEEFLAAYQAAGGGRVSEASTKFYDVFRSLRNVVAVHVSWAGFVTGKYPSFMLALQGVYTRQMLEEALSNSLAGG